MLCRERVRQRLRGLGIGAVVTLVASPVAAVSIRYAATDLPDAIPGEDLWRYEYTLDGFPHGAGHGFSIGFSPDSTVQLQASPTAPGPAWDVITLQPDPLLPADGLFDGLALVDWPSVAMPFAVTFTWSGAGPPGPQPFVVYDAGFHTVESGMTVVPEPGTGSLVAIGVGLLAGWRRRPSRSGAAEGAESP